MVVSPRVPHTKAGTERPAWTDAVEALTTAQTTMGSDATATTRSATGRLIVFASRFLDRPVEQRRAIGGLRIFFTNSPLTKSARSDSI
jgi:hypothetical protein